MANMQQQLGELKEVAVAMKNNRIRIREIFCDKNPECKAACGCHDGKTYDDSKCPLFKHDAAGIEAELDFEYNQAVILGNITE